MIQDVLTYVTICIAVGVTVFRAYGFVFSGIKSKKHGEGVSPYRCAGCAASKSCTTV